MKSDLPGTDLVGVRIDRLSPRAASRGADPQNILESSLAGIEGTSEVFASRDLACELDQRRHVDLRGTSVCRSERGGELERSQVPM